MLRLIIALVTVLVAVVECTDILAYSCDPDSDCRWMTHSSKCVIPVRHGSGEEQLANMFDELADGGCQKLPRPIANWTRSYVVDMVSGAIKEPLRTIVDNQFVENKYCGGCSLKMRCCTNSPSFLEQPLLGEQCFEKNDDACDWPLIKQEDVDTFFEENPQRAVMELKDECDYSIYWDVEFVKEQQANEDENAAALFNALFCSLFKSTHPSLNCRKSRDGRSCQCCCFAYIPTAQGTCVLDKRAKVDAVCARDPNEYGTCARDNGKKEASTRLLDLLRARSRTQRRG